MLSHASKAPVPVLLFLAAFRAAFAFAMLSRKALDDLETFRISASGSRGCSDPFEEFLDVMDDGEVMFDEILEGGCLVFLTVIGEGMVSSGVGLTKVDDRDSRGFNFATSVLPAKRAGLKGRVSPRFEGPAPIIELRFPGPRLCRPNELTEDIDESVIFCVGTDSRLDMDTEDILDEARLVVGDGMSPSSMFK